MLNKKLKAFTLAELLITLALTAIMVTFSYMGLNHIQKLLYQYNDQSLFITQINELNKRISFSFNNADQIQKLGENKLILKSDSSENLIEINPNYILTIKNNQTDSFKVETKVLTIEKEELSAGQSVELVKKLEFDIYFQKQKFHLTFNKKYDSYSKLMIETADGSH